jgi:hypothetical protein
LVQRLIAALREIERLDMNGWARNIALEALAGVDCKHLHYRIEWRDAKPGASETAYGKWYVCEDCNLEWKENA